MSRLPIQEATALIGVRVYPSWLSSALRRGLFQGKCNDAAWVCVYRRTVHTGPRAFSLRRAAVGDMFELLAGNAGIGLGAPCCGDSDLAILAVEPYLRSADPTPGGVNWAVRPSPPRFHHMAHGTLAIVVALATIGSATGRRDLIDLALAGAADVVARNEAGPRGFLVPHSDPQHKPGLIERYSYGWCNGPAGDAHAFRLLDEITDAAGWPGWPAGR